MLYASLEVFQRWIMLEILKFREYLLRIEHSSAVYLLAKTLVVVNLPRRYRSLLVKG